MSDIAKKVSTIKRGKGSYQYLDVKYRVIWFREENPTGHISTEHTYIDQAAGYAACRATITNAEGGSATGLGSCCRADLLEKVKIGACQPDQVEAWLEFAETAAIGALGRLGYGTDDALSEAGPVDSPRQVQEEGQQAEPPLPASAPIRAQLNILAQQCGMGGPEFAAYIKRVVPGYDWAKLTSSTARRVEKMLRDDLAEIQAQATHEAATG